MSPKKLGAPKGAEQATSAAVAATAAETEADRVRRLSSRYQDDPPGGPVWQQHGPPPVAPAPIAAPAPVRVPRTEPEGMTRRTYYLPTEAADALDAAVTAIQAATGGQVSKHAALGALIAAGVEQVDQVAAGLRAELLRRLTGG